MKTLVLRIVKFPCIGRWHSALVYYLAIRNN